MMLLLARRPVVGCPPKKRGGRYEGNGSDQGELIDYGSLPLRSGVCGRAGETPALLQATSKEGCPL
jgi:hypothetical protein